MNKIKNMNKVEMAKEFCIQKHAGQKRKFTGADYKVHPFGVYAIARSITDDEAILSACLLHDTVEDCDVTSQEIGEIFGSEIQSIVHAVTHTMGAGWIDTRLNYLKSLANGPKKALVVALADKIQNTNSLIDAFEEGYDVKSEFPSIDRIKWFNDSICVIAGDSQPILTAVLQNSTARLSVWY